MSPWSVFEALEIGGLGLSVQKGFQKQALWLWTSVVSVLQTKTAVSNNHFLLQASFSPRKTGAHAAPQAQTNPDGYDMLWW